MTYHGKRFQSVSNTENGEVSSQTIFHYQQEGSVVWASYEGGDIVRGSIIGTVDTEQVIHMVYQHLNTQGELRTGRCRSVPEFLSSGKIRLIETWQWTSGDQSSGTSIIEEM